MIKVRAIWCGTWRSLEMRTGEDDDKEEPEGPKKPEKEAESRRDPSKTGIFRFKVSPNVTMRAATPMGASVAEPLLAMVDTKRIGNVVSFACEAASG
ncbi:hypothetical protein V1477_011323 [Vespula maculifrons]|uniref:Uncharacterized protein n=2 Tax=Vespula TaxID=7451 RepID=A0A834NEX9_VESVU|nr:hypothetical protein HZH66_003849 [Vespula vulgaris]